MKNLLSSRGLFILGFVLLLATNIFVLLGVASNRSGAPETLVELTERELRLPYYSLKENSGVSLNLQWRVLGRETDGDDYGYYGHWRNPEWFTAAKLAQLGFDVESFKNFRDDFDKYREPIAKEVFIVLENNSELHAIAIERAQKAYEKAKAQSGNRPDDRNLQAKAKRMGEELEREKVQSSRLFAVDAGLKYKKLRQKYSDESRYIIAKGLVEPSRTYKKGDEKVVGYIRKISIDQIHVPLKHRKIFDAIMAEKKSYTHKVEPPRYSVQLAYGSRQEPWIVSVNKFMRIQIDPSRFKPKPPAAPESATDLEGAVGSEAEPEAGVAPGAASETDPKPEGAADQQVPESQPPAKEATEQPS